MKVNSGRLWLSMASVLALVSGCSHEAQEGECASQSDLHVKGNLYVTGKVITGDPEAGHEPAPADDHGHADGAEVKAQGGHAPGHVAPVDAGSPASVEWNYLDGPGGPSEWSKLHPGFATCESGEAQSPVDIDHASSSTMGPIDFAYQQIPLRISNDGHTVQVDGSGGGWIEFAAKRYQLENFSFHSPSEHRVRGRNYDMVVHLVHRSADGELLYIGVPMVRGKKNLAIDAIWKHFPLRTGERSKHPDVIFSLEALLPDHRSYYSYIGSLTKPPCAEGVRWVFLKSPLSVSAAQIARFTRTFPKSVRPIQPLNGRTVGQGR